MRCASVRFSVLLLFLLLFGGSFCLAEKSLPAREEFEKAVAALGEGQATLARNSLTSLRETLMASRETDDETLLLADTEYALARIAGLQGDYYAAYDLYSSAYVWYKGIRGETDRAALDARLKIIQLQTEHLEMEEQALREASKLCAMNMPGPYRALAMIFRFQLHLRMNNRVGVEETLPVLLEYAESAAEPDNQNEQEASSAVLGKYRSADPSRLSNLILSDYYTETGQSGQALACAEKALRLTQNDPYAQATDQIEALLRIGFVHLFFYGETVNNPWMNEAIDLAEKSWMNRSELAYIYTLAGQMAGEAGNHALCLEYLTKALAVSEHTAGENHPMTADICLLLSPCYRLKGDYQNALAFCERSVRIQLAYLKDDTAMLGSSYNHLANCLADTGDYRGAVSALEKSVSIYRRLGNDLQVAIAERNLALVLNNILLDHEQAMNHLRTALALAERLDQNHCPDTLAAIYILTSGLFTPEDEEYSHIGDYMEKARVCLENAATNVDDIRADYHYLTGLDFMRSGQYQEAFEHLIETKRLYETLYEQETAYPVNIFYDIADCLRLMNDETYGMWYEQAISYANWRMEALRQQGIEDLSYLLSSRDNALSYLREWEDSNDSRQSIHTP